MNQNKSLNTIRDKTKGYTHLSNNEKIDILKNVTSRFCFRQHDRFLYQPFI